MFTHTHTHTLFIKKKSVSILHFYLLSSVNDTLVSFHAHPWISTNQLVTAVFICVCVYAYENFLLNIVF